MSYTVKLIWYLSLTVFLYSCQIVQAAAPTFLVPISSTPARPVSENSIKDVSILTVEGQDTDGDTLSYAIASQNPSSPPFLLDGTSGELKTPNGIDAEFSQQYVFTFTVSDSTTTVTSVPFTVNIIDVNEFTPVFHSTPYTASFLDTVSNGYSVFTVNATDGDVTASVAYSITGGNTGKFDIDSTTGSITVADNNQLLANSPYTLTIQATDGTNSATADIAITVNEDYCSPNPCENSGNCTLTGNSYSCTCTPPYIGQNCTEDDPCDPNPCQNGGTCNAGTGSSYTCTCASGFTGTNCVDTASTGGGNTTDTSKGNTVTIIVVIIVVGVLLIVAAGIVYVLHKKRKIRLENCLKFFGLPCHETSTDPGHETGSDIPLKGPHKNDKVSSNETGKLNQDSDGEKSDPEKLEPVAEDKGKTLSDTSVLKKKQWDEGKTESENKKSVEKVGSVNTKPGEDSTDDVHTRI